MDLPEPGGPHKINGLWSESHWPMTSACRAVSTVLITMSERVIEFGSSCKTDFEK
jgi:hypothetical protein